MFHAIETSYHLGIIFSKMLCNNKELEINIKNFFIPWLFTTNIARPYSIFVCALLGNIIRIVLYVIATIYHCCNLIYNCALIVKSSIKLEIIKTVYFFLGDLKLITQETYSILLMLCCVTLWVLCVIFMKVLASYNLNIKQHCNKKKTYSTKT